MKPRDQHQGRVGRGQKLAGIVHAQRLHFVQQGGTLRRGSRVFAGAGQTVTRATASILTSESPQDRATEPTSLTFDSSASSRPSGPEFEAQAQRNPWRANTAQTSPSLAGLHATLRTHIADSRLSASCTPEKLRRLQKTANGFLRV